MDTGVRNVIFDMGNVLMTFDGPYFSSCFKKQYNVLPKNYRMR